MAKTLNELLSAKVEEKNILASLEKKICKAPFQENIIYGGFSYSKEKEQPETIYDGNKKVDIILSGSSKKFPLQASFQLAHEMIHTLTPCIFQEVNYLEEGLAINFQFDYISKFKGKQEGDKYYEDSLESLKQYTKYRDAWDLVKDLERKSNKDIYQISREILCTKKIRLCDISMEILEKVSGITDKTLLERLTSKFNS